MKTEFKNQRLDFIFQNRLCFYRDRICVKTGQNEIFDFQITCSKNKIKARLGSYGDYEECFEISGDQVISLVSINIATNKPFIVQCPVNYRKTNEPPYFMIPGFLYGTNNLAGSDGNQPKLDYGGKINIPVSPVFFIRSDRSANSSVIRIADGTYSMVAVDHVIRDIQVAQKDKWSPAHLYTGLMLDTSEKEHDITGFQIGYENYPFRYSWRKEDEVPASHLKCCGLIEGLKGKKLKLKVIYCAGTAQDRTVYGEALKIYYQHFHQVPKKVGKRNEAMTDIGEALIEYGYNREHKFFNLVDDDFGRQIGDIAWTGGMQAAYPLLKAGDYLKNARFKNTAIEFIDNLCQKALNRKSGLFMEEFRDGQWQVTGWWGTREDCFNFGDAPLHSAYLNGQCTYYILKSYFLPDQRNDQWLTISESVLVKVLYTQNTDGAFGVFFDPETGNAVDYDGFQGCWFVPAFALLFKATGNHKYLVSAERAIDHYYQWHLNGELYNTPMDTHKAVDEEGNLAFIAACRELHELTGKQKYLDYGLVGLIWEFSWKFAYNTLYSNNPLRDLDWSSSGGSITSTHNPSIHQMGSLVAGDMYYFYQQTGDEYIKQRLIDTCIWGLNAYNVRDGYLGFGKKGMATEQFTYTDGVVLPWPHPWDGGIWEANLPWAAACILLACAENIPDEFFGE